jgi:pimeloyl-ACP methyl ester carboxylesterase
MFITSGDAQIYTVSFGNGPRTLLALGGWTGSWELWAEPFTILSSSWRTAAYDHRGAGATVAPAGSITLDAMVGDVFAVMDALGIESCVLAAESTGGAVALSAALQQPERFTGLVLVDAIYYRPAPQKEDLFLLGLKSHYQQTLAQFVDACLTERDSDAVRRWGRLIVGRSPQEAAIRLYECMFGVDLRPQLRQITQPTLILHGSADSLVPVDSSGWLASQLPTCHLEVLDGVGHVPTITHADVVAAAINRYFEGKL